MYTVERFTQLGITESEVEGEEFACRYADNLAAFDSTLLVRVISPEGECIHQWEPMS